MNKRILSLALALCLLLSLGVTVSGSYSKRSVSDECVEFIKAYEGYAQYQYEFSGDWYIGYGSSCYDGEYPNGISEDEASALLKNRLEGFAGYVNQFLRQYGVAVTQEQFDALCSMTYNFGPAWLNVSNRLPSYLANGIENYSEQEIINAFAAWCHIGTQVNDNLLRRRLGEAELFLYGDYSGSVSDWCRLILDPGEGEVAGDVWVCRAGEPYGTLPEATLEGYTLAGWETESGKLLSVSDIAESQKVTACWVDENQLKDIAADAWYYDCVSELSSRGIISGYEDGSFRPDNEVTYAQALKLIILAAGFPEKQPDEDEPEAHWAQGYLDFAVAQGYVNEAVEQLLDESITRDEIADICAAALELDSSDVEWDDFDDSDRTSVLALSAVGIVEGSIENGLRLYRGQDYISRAEISAVIWRTYEYVRENYILFKGFRIPINFDLRQNPYDGDAFYTDNERVFYDDDNYDVQYGIDVSFYQKDIDWQAVAADGIDFAIIRAGYRGCSEGSLNEDVRFREYVEGAIDAGLDVGVYFFSQAISVEEAVEEAEYLLQLIADYDINYPVAFDWEPLNYSYSRTLNYDCSDLTDSAIAFCDTIAEAGYTPMVYYNPTFAYFYYDLERLEDRISWLANYTEKTDYQYDFHMWQYGSSGTVDGIAGRVDMNISFYDFG